MGGNPHDPLTTTNSSEELTMAEANHKTVAPVSERFVTISSQRRPRPIRSVQDFYRPRNDLPPAPWIRLAGRWLEKAGFEINSRIRVEVQRGKLVITLAG
jgi:toxic protein SymE